MRKLINDPFSAVDEMLGGLVATFPSAVRLTESGRGVLLSDRAPRRVGVIVGGGSGHEPAFLGYLGPGLADAAAVGNVFASPAATPAVECARAVAGDDGVLFLYGNYEGDIMNFGMATELLADEGASGEEVAAAAAHANARTRSVGVGLGPCTVPTAGRPTFELPDGEMDIGMGVHGEVGIRRAALAPADEVVDELVDVLLGDLPPRPGEPVQVLINTLGATPLMEGLIAMRRVALRLSDEGVTVHRALVGEYVTSLEMVGMSLTLTHLDGELIRLLDAPCQPLLAPRMGAWR